MKTETNNVAFPPIIYWNKFDDIKPNGDEEYLVTNSDGVIRVSYFDGTNWGYYSAVKEEIIYWSILPKSPL
jgi:hypothetical protein